MRRDRGLEISLPLDERVSNRSIDVSRSELKNFRTPFEDFKNTCSKLDFQVFTSEHSCSRASIDSTSKAYFSNQAELLPRSALIPPFSNIANYEITKDESSGGFCSVSVHESLETIVGGFSGRSDPSFQSPMLLGQNCKCSPDVGHTSTKNGGNSQGLSTAPLPGIRLPPLVLQCPSSELLNLEADRDHAILSKVKGEDIKDMCTQSVEVKCVIVYVINDDEELIFKKNLAINTRQFRFACCQANSFDKMKCCD